VLEGSPTHTRGAQALPGFFSGATPGAQCRVRCSIARSLLLDCSIVAHCFVAALAIWAPARIACAEQPVTEITVTAQPPSPAQAKAPTAFVTDIETDEHALEVETVADALAESVGVQVRRFGGLGAFSTISIRGSSSNQVDFFLDGVPLSRARNETVNLSDLPLDALQRIEVYRGTAPVGFGSPIGGAVNLVTKPPSDQPATELSASYGSFLTRKAVVSHSRRIGAFSLLGHVSYLGSEGNFEFEDDRATQNPLDDRTVTRKNNAFNSVEALFKAGYSAGGFDLDLTSETFFKDQGVPGPGNAQFTDPSLREWRALNYLRASRPGLLHGDLDASATLFGVFERSEFQDEKGQLGGLAQDRRDDTALLGSSSTGTYYGLPAQALSWFTELSRETFAGYNDAATRGPKDEPDQKRLTGAISLQDEIELFDSRLLLVPTVRWQHLRDDVSATFDAANQPSGPQETKDRDLWSPSIGASLTVLPWLSLRGNLGRYQRAPNFSELFGNRGNVRGRPDLKPETAINRDVGFVASYEHLSWLDRLRAEYAYFNNDVDDIIVLVQTGPNFFTPRNVGAARIRGHELALHAEALSHFGVDVNYTHQDAENRSDNPNFRGKQLPDRPQDEVYLRLETFAPLGKLFYEFNLVSGNYTGEANLERIPTRDVHTLGIAVHPRPWLTASFEARNVTDNQISDVGGFPLPGRSYFFTIKADL
jgi:outer membrane cobalamin receptor